MNNENKRMLIELAKEFLNRTNTEDVEIIDVISDIDSTNIQIYWKRNAPSLESEYSVESPEFDYLP